MSLLTFHEKRDIYVFRCVSIVLLNYCNNKASIQSSGHDLGLLFLTSLCVVIYLCHVGGGNLFMLRVCLFVCFVETVSLLLSGGSRECLSGCYFSVYTGGNVLL